MKNLSKSLLMMIGYVLVAIFIININATMSSSISRDFGSDLNACYNSHTFKSPAIASSAQVNICVKNTCMPTTRQWAYNYPYGVPVVECANGNKNPFISLAASGNVGCAKYAGSCSLTPQDPYRYCSEVYDVVCTKNKDGSTYNQTTKTTTKTTSRTTTPKKSTTPKRSTTPNNNSKTTTTTTTTIPVQSDNAYLASLTVDQGTLNFTRDVFEYNIEVEKAGVKLNVVAVPEDPDAVFKIENNTEIKPEVPIVVTVTAPNGATRKYTINIKVKKTELDNNARLSKIEIENYKKAFLFDPGINSYNLTIKNESSLNIKVETESAYAEYSILGNVKLKDKSQIQIKVTAENGHEETYIINIKKSNTNLTTILIVLIVLGLAGFVGFKLIRGLLGNKVEAGETNYEYE